MFKSGFILFQATYVFIVLVNYSKTAVMHSVFECSLRRMQPINLDAVMSDCFNTIYTNILSCCESFFVTSLFSTTSWMKADGLLCSGTCLLPQTPLSIPRQPLLGGAHIRCVTWTYISSAGNKLLVLLCDFSYCNYSTSELIGILSYVFVVTLLTYMLSCIFSFC